MSRLSEFLDDNPSVTKILAAALAVGAIAAAGTALKPAVAEIAGPESRVQGAAEAAGNEIRATLAVAAEEFDGMLRLFDAGADTSLMRHEILSRAFSVQDRLLGALERIDGLDEEIGRQVLLQRPAVIAWRASRLLVDFDEAMESNKFQEMRGAVEYLHAATSSASYISEAESPAIRH